MVQKCFMIRKCDETGDEDVRIHHLALVGVKRSTVVLYLERILYFVLQ